MVMKFSLVVLFSLLSVALSFKCHQWSVGKFTSVGAASSCAAGITQCHSTQLVTTSTGGATTVSMVGACGTPAGGSCVAWRAANIAAAKVAGAATLDAQGCYECSGDSCNKYQVAGASSVLPSVALAMIVGGATLFA